MFGPKELVVVLVVLVIVLVVFGPKRIKSLGSELGNAIKGFRTAVREKDAEDQDAGGPEPAANAALKKEAGAEATVDAGAQSKV